MQPRKRMLLHSDFGCSTGFSRVAEALVSRLVDEYDFVIIAVNYSGYASGWHALYPRVKIYPAKAASRKDDPFGRDVLLQLLAAKEEEFDILFTIQDTPVIEPIAHEIVRIQLAKQSRLAEHNAPAFKWVYYFPIDSVPKEKWIMSGPWLADVPVVFTAYGLGQIEAISKVLAARADVIHHGVDTQVFRPLKNEEGVEVEDFREKYFARYTDGKFLITNVNSNTLRKDIPATIRAFAELKKTAPDVYLYLHTQPVTKHYNLPEIAKMCGLKMYRDYMICNPDYRPDYVGDNVLNLIYNASDLVVSTSMGEGWGLTTSEAAAAGAVTLTPAHTSFSEVNPWYFSNICDEVIMPRDNDVIRYRSDYKAFARQMALIKEFRSDGDLPKDARFKPCGWDEIAGVWRRILAQALGETLPWNGEKAHTYLAEIMHDRKIKPSVPPIMRTE